MPSLLFRGKYDYVEIPLTVVVIRDRKNPIIWQLVNKPQKLF
jgi:hypothetical protein